MSSVSALNSLLSSTTGSSANGSSLNLSSLLAAATGATSVGIDVTSAVDAAIYAARAPERQWQSQQSTLQSQMTALHSLQGALSSVTQDLDALNDPNGALTARAVSSSNVSAVTASATDGTTVGPHTVSVARLATSASWYSSPLSNASAALGSSVLTVTQNGGAQTSFALGSNGLTSLTALSQAINAASLGVSASVITDANGSRLALVGQATGAAADFSVSDGPSVAAASWVSATVSSPTALLGASSLQIGDGSSTVNVSVAAGTSLRSLATQISNLGLNLSASIVSDSSGAHLAIAAAGSNAVTVSSDPTLTLTQPTQGANASLTVDGVPISSTSNTVTGVIPGVTLTLQGVSSGDVMLDVNADSSRIASSLSQFVTDYNSAITQVSSQFTYNTISSSQGVLGGDATVRSLQSALLGITSYTATTAASPSSSVRSLASIGITQNNDGTLSFNQAHFGGLVNADPSAVLTFFQNTALNGFAYSAKQQIDTFSNAATGVLTADTRNMTQQHNDLQTHINSFESGYIASQQTVLTHMYSKAEIALQQLPSTLKQLQAQLGGGNSGG